jgi:Tfp pilus assembly protein PilO
MKIGKATETSLGDYNMSSTPAAPKVSTQSTVSSVTHLSEIAAIEKKIGVWLDPKHIILSLLLVLSVVAGVYLYESREADVASAKAAIATEVAKAAQQTSANSAIQNAAIQEQTKEVEQAMAAVTAQLQAANTQLIAANKELTNKLLTQQTADTTLTPTQQSLRWQTLEPKAQVTPTSTGFSVDAAGGLATIQDLEELPLDRQRIINLDSEITNLTTEVSNDATALTSEKTAHASDVANDAKALTAAQDETKKVNADFTAYKHKARKNYIKAFFAGVVAGFLGAHAAGV